MRECGISYETDPSLSSSRLEVILYDDCESSLRLEPDLVIDSPLTSLEEVIDHPLTFLPFVAPFLPNIPRDTTEDVLRLFSSPLPLAQRKRLEISESLKDDASSIEDDLLDWSGNIALLEPSFKELYSDDVRIGAALNIKHIASICTKSLDLVPIASAFPPSDHSLSFACIP